jgi:hypothetical protein
MDMLRPVGMRGQFVPLNRRLIRIDNLAAEWFLLLFDTETTAVDVRQTLETDE